MIALSREPRTRRPDFEFTILEWNRLPRCAMRDRSDSRWKKNQLSGRRAKHDQVQDEDRPEEIWWSAFHGAKIFSSCTVTSLFISFPHSSLGTRSPTVRSSRFYSGDSLKRHEQERAVSERGLKYLREQPRPRDTLAAMP